MAALKEVSVPDIGDFKDVEVIEVLVHPGDEVSPEQSLITLETDKATMEIPSPARGIVRELSIKPGDKVSKGSLILKLEESAATAPVTAGAAAAAAVPAPISPAQPASNSAAGAPVPAPAHAASSAPAAAPTPVLAGNGAATPVVVPDIGDFKDVEVIELLVKPGDMVRKEQSLVTLESDKATMEIPSPEDGIVAELLLRPGDKVSRGSPILMLKVSNPISNPVSNPVSSPISNPGHQPVAVMRDAPIAAQEVRAPQALVPVADFPAEGSGGAKPHASPSVRKFARELGVELARVEGSGPKGRVLHEDVQRFVKQSLSASGAAAGARAPAGLDVAPWPQIDFSRFGPVENVPLSRVQKISGPALHRNWVSIPHVTQFADADITDLEAFRKEQAGAAEKNGIKLTLLAFLVKATVAALKAFPQFNASLAPGNSALILKKYYHIGVAVDTPEGLVVPVLRNADQKGVIDIARELAELSRQTRERKVKAADLQGGSFSISSLGGIGGTAFTPIINAPEVAILGVSRAVMHPVWNGSAFAPRLMLPLSLSYDHRAIDGASGARFVTHLAGVLADMRRSLL